VDSKEDVEGFSYNLRKVFQEKGITVSMVKIPQFNEHPHQCQLNTILFIIGVIGFLAFIMGAVLVSQLIRSIMINQIRQIGILKATGAPRIQIFQIYITILLLLGLISGLIAIPLAVTAGTAYANFVAGILNFNIYTEVPHHLFFVLVFASMMLPVLLSFPTRIKGTGISVREALSDYGITKNTGVKEFKFLRILKLLNAMVLAIRNSLRNRKRLTVTIATMALGVAIFITGFNIRQSLWELLSGLQNELGYDVQVVLSKQISKQEALGVFKTLENVQRVETWNGGSGDLQSRVLSTAKGAGIISLPYNSELLKPKILDGRWLQLSNDMEAVMNQKAWNLYGNPFVGSNVNMKIGDKNIMVKLIGVMEQFDLAKIYVDTKKYDALFNPQHLINTLVFVAKDNEYKKVIELKKDIEKSILPSNLNVLYVMSGAERVKVIYDHLNIILSVIVFLSFLVLLVSAVGMASATGINIWERTREIGVMRAIGATPKKTYSMFVNEGMIISMVSILTGLLLSYPLSQSAAVFFGNLMLGEEAVLQYAFSPLDFFITLIVTLLFGWLASRILAKSAVGIPTHQALLYE